MRFYIKGKKDSDNFYLVDLCVYKGAFDQDVSADSHGCVELNDEDTKELIEILTAFSKRPKQ